MKKYKPKTVFKSERHKTNDAILQLKFDKWYYAVGYRDAAEFLARKASRLKGFAGRQGLMYPTLFLYRHYLELILKSIIDSGAVRHGGNGAPRTHDLLRLWALAKRYILASLPDRRGSSEITWAEELIQEFASIDKNSDGFRYPSQVTAFVNPNRLIRSMQTRTLLLRIAAHILMSEAKESATH